MKKGKMKGKAWGVLLVLIGFVLSLSVSTATVQEPYKIGVSLGITGVQGQQDSANKAVELAVEMINAKEEYMDDGKINCRR
jgi:rhamnose utilization protein RhaD (predicted bifunctional aldolase and dehydrogenase)